MTDIAELERRIAILTGKMVVLGIAVNALIRHHPAQEAAIKELLEDYERVLANAAPEPLPEAFLDGMKTMLETYVLGASSQGKKEHP